jgi:hypothetical protein
MNTVMGYNISEPKNYNMFVTHFTDGILLSISIGEIIQRSSNVAIKILDRILYEAEVPKLRILSLNLAQGTEDNHDNRYSPSLR